MESIYNEIAEKMKIQKNQVKSVITMLQEGATIPFISRYRKEATGSLDEVIITAIRDLYEKFSEREKRKVYIISVIEKQEKLTPELKKEIQNCSTLEELEDIYLPYKPKKRTRAQIAREKGLEEAANFVFNQTITNPESELIDFIDPEKGVGSIDDVLGGCRDIIAEMINENTTIRRHIRSLYEKKAELKSTVIKSKEKNEAAAKYRDYFDWHENVLEAPSHRVLAVMRGMNEGFLRVRFAPDEDEAFERIINNLPQKKDTFCYNQIIEAAKDSYQRLMGPSIENEIKTLCKKKADEEAVRVFASNLRELLLAAPLGRKNILAVDPGLRTGCKVVILNRQGDLMFNTTIFPLEPKNENQKSADIIMKLCEKYQIEAVAVGNGTGGKEALSFVKSIGLPDIIITMVNESGASIYSASETARREFPDHDVTVRGAVSIGRRLMDPLSELVKIDPKSIGVGQYQHDVDQKLLKRSLDEVVESCVNSVGVDVNTSSAELLKYVSGLSEKLAASIIKYRTENNGFQNRIQLKKVSGMGEKTFEQAAGFLRVPESSNPLDASAVHPESYYIVEKMAEDAECTVVDLLKYKEKRQAVSIEKYITETVGIPTLQDIFFELEKPGRDPRKDFELFSFTEGIDSIQDLKAGMKLSGVITNVTAFGAFVDIGVHQDGLVHISKLSHSYINDPSEIVRVNQKVNVTVIDVDVNRKRISLSMIE